METDDVVCKLTPDEGFSTWMSFFLVSKHKFGANSPNLTWWSILDSIERSED